LLKYKLDGLFKYKVSTGALSAISIPVKPLPRISKYFNPVAELKSKELEILGQF
jgi:hypothetical protein